MTLLDSTCGLEPLMPSGQHLGHTGTFIGPAAPSCGTPLLVAAMTPAMRRAIGQADRAVPPPQLPWNGADMRRSCCAHGTANADRPVFQYVRSNGLPGPDAWRLSASTGVLPPAGGLPLSGHGAPPGAVPAKADGGPDPHDDDGGGRPGPGEGGEDDDASVDCPPVPLTVPAEASVPDLAPDDIRDLAGRERISLGPGPGGTVLEAFVPAGYSPGRSKADMLEAYLPDWRARCVPAGEADWAMAHRCVLWDSEPVAGLFWDDGLGYYHRALLYGILTLYGYRGEATAFSRMATTCHIDGETIGRWVEDRKRWVRSSSDQCGGTDPGVIQVASDGQVSAWHQDYGDFSAWAFDGKVRLCARVYKLEAALADYYLYWAHRLFSYYMDGCGTERHYEVGYLCARAALSEITEIACIILHELSHLTGSLFHCSPDVAPVPEDYPLAGMPGSAWGDWGAAIVGAIVGILTWLGTVTTPWIVVIAVLLAELLEELFLDTADPPQDCCQYGLADAFRARLWARLGIPGGHAWGAADSDHAGSRFQRPDRTPLPLQFSFVDTCELGTGPNMTGEIHQFLTPSSGGSMQWAIPTECASDAPSSGVYSW